MKTVYVSIGNSDDKLTQEEWSRFTTEVDDCIRAWAQTVHSAGYSLSDSRWQNACWCIEIGYDEEERSLLQDLRILAKEFRQDAIAWAEVSSTTMIGPTKDSNA